MPKKNLKSQPYLQILGVSWDQNRDKLCVGVPEFNEKLIVERNVLCYIAKFDIC